MLGPWSRRLKIQCFLEKNAPPNFLLHAWPLVKTAENHVKMQCFLEINAPPNVLLHAWPLVQKAENHVFSREKCNPQCIDACLAPCQEG